jgi:hypothetical protein
VRDRLAVASCSPRFRILNMSWLPSSPYLPEERLDVFDGRRFERLEAVVLVHALDDADDSTRAAVRPRTENRACRALVQCVGPYKRERRERRDGRGRVGRKKYRISHPAPPAFPAFPAH